MISAYRACYLKDAREMRKRTDTYCVIEIQLKEQNFTQVLIINDSGLVLAINAKAVTAIKGYRSYSPENSGISEFGAGGLEKLNTKDPGGMLEGLAKQLQFDYSVLSQAFGEGLLKLARIE